MKTATVAAAALLLSGCMTGKPTHSVLPADLPYTVDDREAYARVLRSVVNADLSVEMKDADGGIVQTEWHKSHTQLLGCFFMPVATERRVRFKVVMSEGRCSIKPQVAMRSMAQHGEWTHLEGSDVTDAEAAVFDTLAREVRTSLAK